MKTLILTALIMLGCVFSQDANSGQETNGGLVVLVDGQWIPLEEAVNYETAEFFGIGELPTGDPNSPLRPVFNKPYRIYLEKWLAHLKSISPSQAQKIWNAGQLPRIVYVNRPLSAKPTTLPTPPIEFKFFKKAAVYIRGAGDYGTIYVSIPVMENMGSLGKKRLSVEENQGFILLHELLHVAYPETSVNQRFTFGEQIISSLLLKLSSVEFGFRVMLRGGPYISDEAVSLEESLAVIRLAQKRGLLNQSVNFEGMLFNRDIVRIAEAIIKLISMDKNDLLKRFQSKESYKNTSWYFKRVNQKWADRFVQTLLTESQKKVSKDELFIELSKWWVPSIADVYGGDLSVINQLSYRSVLSWVKAECNRRFPGLNCTDYLALPNQDLSFYGTTAVTRYVAYSPSSFSASRKAFPNWTLFKLVGWTDYKSSKGSWKGKLSAYKMIGKKWDKIDYKSVCEAIPKGHAKSCKLRTNFFQISR